MEKRDQLNRFVFTFIALGFCLFCAISLISFNVNDVPNKDVASGLAVRNLCGEVGAYIAYYGFYYLGPSLYIILAAVVTRIIIYCIGQEVNQTLLRMIGLLLICATVSSIFYLINPGDVHSLSQGNGGVLGISFGHFLMVKTAKIGTILILAATLLVGLLLTADELVLLIPKLTVVMFAQLLGAGEAIGRVKTKAGELAGRVGQTGSVLTQKTAENTKRKPAALKTDPDLEEVTNEQEPYVEELPEEVFKQDDFGDEELADADIKIKVKTPPKTNPAALAQIIPRPQASICPAGASDEDYPDYKFPPMDLLEEPVRGFSALQEKLVKERSVVLERTLNEFNIDAKVVEAETGPVITMFELELAPGIKVSQITNLSNDLARSLGAPAVRVVAPISGKHTIGIEVPNSEKETVRIKELFQLGGQKPGKMQIPLFLGKDASGNPLIIDLTRMPHCLIAGTTGSGKSVCINSIIASILLTQMPNRVKLILIDPKMVEMSMYRDLAHLMCPIVTEMKRAEQILEWLTEKMDERYALLAEAGVRNITDYNLLDEEKIYERMNAGTDGEKARIPSHLPYIVMIIDELADLMMTSAKEVEAYIIRLAQKSRAVGIHIVLATQRPQATVVTGLIKSNLPTRISFRVAARMDSRIVLDQNGAEALLGQGDMLFLQPGTSELVRCQGTYISDDEVNRIVTYLKEVAQPNYHPELVQLNRIDTDSMERDELFDDAVRIVLETKRGSVSLLQRRLTIGYSRASRLIDQMAAAGIVGEYKGSQAREVMMSLEEYDAIYKQMQREAVAGYKDLQEDEPESAEVAADVDDEEIEDAVEAEDAEIEQEAEDVEDEEDTDDVSPFDDEPLDEDEEEYEEDEEDAEYEYVDEEDAEEEEPTEEPRPGRREIIGQ